MSETPLDFHLEWTPKDDDGADGATWGRLFVSFGREIVWGNPRSNAEVQGLEWTWLDLAEHLANEWPWVLWEEGWPLGIDVHDPRSLAHLVEDHFAQLTRSQDAIARRKWLEWKTSHDLASALHGAWDVPPIWIVREGSMCWVATPKSRRYLPFVDVIQELERLVDRILERAKSLAPDDPRTVDIASHWGKRRSRRIDECVAIATGLPTADLAAIAGGRPISEFFQASRDFEPNELTVVTRMLGPHLGPEILRRVLQIVRGAGRGAFSPELDRLASELTDGVLEPSTAPYEQGYSLAQRLRGVLNLAPSERADPEAVLESCGVEIHHVDLGSDSEVLDGLAFWGAEHGPAAVVNKAGKHSQSARGTRATLAHELCHVLVDRTSALPLAEVRDLAPTLQEQRANAFAAEFLIPRDVAGEAFANDESNPDGVMRSLARRFDASFTVIAWQALNSDRIHAMDEKVLRFLKSKVPPGAAAQWRYSGAE